MAHPPADESQLDNVVWHALQGPLARFADPAPAAAATSAPDLLRFEPEVSPFSAVEVVDDAAWGALAERVGPGGTAALFRDVIAPAPEGWTEVFRATVCQLVADELAPAPGCDALPLGDADAAEMLALALLTEPGPFVARTHELGGYHGVRRDGRLVAMAGQRFQVTGYREISAVCTHPDARREGLGAALTLLVAEQIRAAGDEAFLHVMESNENALRLYQSLGFRIRRTNQVVAAEWQSGAS